MKWSLLETCSAIAFRVAQICPPWSPSNSNTTPVSVFLCVCISVCLREMVNEQEHRHSPWSVVMWFGEILCEGSGGYFPGSDSRAWVVSEVISVKFAYSGAPIQTARHHNASPSVTHNDCVPLELVIFVFAASSAPGHLASQLLTASNGLSC